MQEKAFLSFLLLSLLSIIYISPSEALVCLDDEQGGEARWRHLEPCWTPPKSPGTDLRRECLSRFKHIAGCRPSYLRSKALGNKADISRECCNAILNLPNACYEIFRKKVGLYPRDYCHSQIWYPQEILPYIGH
ncbi:uncharacterized protein A4U43_C04F21590 [Asparagus officinalis]|uniref:Prolamin-like domain-containing protein n=1 Tax=Asparagus officinalis TaxID=4686 RepID=A0A5P1F7E9_ASPOF|nr:uncharacterized protein A4U43_C04F21590 [Asparagus officinalis]